MTDPQGSLGEQDRRRRAGVPSISVLIGPVGLGGACWRRWCALNGKDWELQRRGYLVLRFLAEDIVPRLEDVLGAILTAVAWRREAGCEKEQSC